MKTKTEIQSKLKYLYDGIDQMTGYLEFKKGSADWHGVEDAASDIRDMYAAIDALEWVIEE